MKVVVARIMENGILKGFATVDSNDGYVVVLLSEVNHHTYLNAKFDFKFKTLVGTMGSLSDYPEMDTKGNLISKNGLAIVQQDGITYQCFDANGKMYKLGYNELAKAPIHSNYECNNGVVTSKGIPFPNSGRVDNSDKLKTVYYGKVGKGDQVVRVSANLKKFTPYYALILSSLRKKSVVGFGTCGVTEDTLVYDDEFMKTLTLGEMTFCFIHEVLHIVMQHSIRRGGRDPEMWNIACDLFINSTIMQNFGVVYGGDEIKSQNGGVIKYIPGCVYMESVGMTIDLAKETPESIYTKLVHENPNGAGNGSGGSNSSDSDSQEGNNSQQGKGNQGDSQSSNSSQSDSSLNDDDSNSGSSQGSGSDTHRPEVKEVCVSYNGKKIKGKVIMDVMTNNSDSTPEALREKIEASKQVLQNIKTNIMQAEQDGYSIDIQGSVQREIEFGLALGVNWKVLLRNACKTNPKKMFTLGDPNRDYMNMGLTVASRSKIGKPKDISDIVIAVDVSGSVSKQKLDYFLSSVAGIFKYYNASGKLIYWSTNVGACGDFSDMRDLLKVKPNSTGGTDVKCLFDYLYKNRIKTKILIVITDGCFSKNYAEYAKWYGRQTIWLIDGNARAFDAPFGRVVALEEEN